MDQMRWPFYMYRADFQRIGEHTTEIDTKTNKRARTHAHTHSRIEAHIREKKRRLKAQSHSIAPFTRRRGHKGTAAAAKKN